MPIRRPNSKQLTISPRDLTVAAATPSTPDFVAGSSASTQALRDEPLKDPPRFREAVPG
jgi:hypothetical protein